MAFVKGQSGNPKGREKGSHNKVTTELRQVFKGIVEGWSPYIEADLRQLEPKDRMKIILEMCAYFMPRMQTASIEAKVNSDVTIDIYKQLNDMTKLSLPGSPSQIKLGNGDVESEPSQEAAFLMQGGDSI